MQDCRNNARIKQPNYRWFRGWHVKSSVTGKSMAVVIGSVFTNTYDDYWSNPRMTFLPSDSGGGGKRQ